METPTKITVDAFDHITLIVADLAATRRFYVELLGMKEVVRPAFAFAGLWFQVGSVQVHATLQNTEAGLAGWGKRENTVVARGHHFAFQVANVAQSLEIARAAGVHVASELQERPDGFRQAYLYDPDGHVVELVSR